MSYPTIFANLAAGNQPLSLLDAMFNVVAQSLAIPCTASGQNAVVLTPIGNAPTLAAYATFANFRFKAVATSNAAVTVQFGALAALPAYDRDGTTQVASGGLVSGNLYLVIYDPALNSGGGGFWLEQSTIPIVTTVGGGSFSGLRIVNDTVTPDTKVDLSADEIVMVRPSDGSLLRSANLSVIVDSSVSGVVNGLDTGSLTFSSWYYLWAISNGSAVGGLISLSSTSPTLPAGYTYLKRVGALRTDITHGQTSTVTITIASPGVVTWNAHGLAAGTPIVFTTTGALPTGLTAGTTYYVSATGLAANTFEVSTTIAGAVVNTSGTQSGTHTATIPAVRFLRTIQIGNTAGYQVIVGTSTQVLPLIASGTAGTISDTNPVLASVSVATVVPPTAAEIRLNVTRSYKGGTLAGVAVAPNTTWGGTTFGPTGSSGQVWPYWINSGGFTGADGLSLTMLLEASTIAWASNNTGGGISAMGWVDNI